MATQQAPITQPSSVEFRGPSDSSTYNLRLESNYSDLTILYNRINLFEQQMTEIYGRFVKDELNIMQMLGNLEYRVGVLEQNQVSIAFSDFSQLDTGRFDGTSFAIPAPSQLTQDSLHGLLTLPQVPSSSISKLAFVDPNTGLTNVPSSLSTSIVGTSFSADNANTATIISSPPELAMARNIGRIWQRNVIASGPNVDGAQMTLYVRCPQDIFTTANSNALFLHPFPAFGTNIVDVAYTTNVSPTMTDADGYQNFPQLYTNTNQAVGWVPPGSWDNGADIDITAGFRGYYFDPIPITGLRFQLSQFNYYQENGQYIYSYGASLIDLQYIKFLNSGSIIVLLNAPNNKTISNIESVQPQIYNVLQAEIPDVFSYQPIWETSYNSGIYTSNPVPFSHRVWIQINLSQTANGATPSLSGLSVTYS